MCVGASETPARHRQWKGPMQAQGIQARDRRKISVCGLSGWSERHLLKMQEGECPRQAIAIAPAGLPCQGFK
ncbi:hypothetical protein ABBQ38_010664 [Trebouxia sp. C0009 RCD-2024]